LNVSSSVAMPRISSTSAISGTGFMKCMPMNLPGRSVEAARRVIEIDEVLVAMMVSGPSSGTSFLKMPRLTSSFSVAASMTISQPRSLERSETVTMRFIAASLSAWVTLPLLTWRSMFLPMVSTARFSASSLMSERRTS
jgi:hypothetical protein